jgi:hypothetical protein
MIAKNKEASLFEYPFRGRERWQQAASVAARAAVGGWASQEE